MKISVDMTGLDGFEERLIELAELPGAQAELLQMGEDIRKQAIANLSDGTPPDSRSGQLADSLQVEIDETTGSVRVGTPLNYGAALEFGTVSAPEKPWFGPAVATVVQNIGPRFRRVMANMLRELKGRVGPR